MYSRVGAIIRVVSFVGRIVFLVVTNVGTRGEYVYVVAEKPLSERVFRLRR